MSKQKVKDTEIADRIVVCREKIGAYILYGKNEEKTKRAEQKKTNLERFAELSVELQDKLLAVVETMNSLK